MSSISRSITVCRRRAPMFSVRSLTCQAASARRRIPSWVNSMLTLRLPSAPCTDRSGRRRAGQDAHTEVVVVRRSSSTRIGRRPCSSGMRSDGLTSGMAPGGDKQDVIGLDHAVLGVDGQPSTSGSRSR